MPKQTLYFTNPAELSLSNGQLKIRLLDESEHLRPIEDIRILIVDHHSVHLTVPLLTKLSENNVSVVFCNESHIPVSMTMDLDANCRQTKFFRGQLEAALPMKKQIWKQIVEHKIRNQARHSALFGWNLFAHRELYDLSDFKIGKEYVDICNNGLRANTTGQAIEGRILQGVGKGWFLVVEQEYVGALLHDAGQCADTPRARKAADTRAKLCDINTGCGQAVRLYVQPLRATFPTKKCPPNAPNNRFD